MYYVKYLEFLKVAIIMNKSHNSSKKKEEENVQY